MNRTHNNGELRISDVNKIVELKGWVAKKRNLGSLVFIDLRDRYGITQIVLNEEMEDMINSMYEPDGKERIFPLSKRYFQHEMERGSEMSGVPKIRLHDLRHSHVSLLINMGFSALEIAERMGHESIRITYHYAHLFPSKQLDMVNKLDQIKGELSDVG